MSATSVRGVWSIVKVSSHTFGDQSVEKSSECTIEFAADEILATDGLNQLTSEYRQVGNRLEIIPGPSTTAGYDGRDLTQVRLSDVVADLMNSETVTIAQLDDRRMVMTFTEGAVELVR